MEDLVSIITPAYNAEKYISQTIESVIAQSYKNWEMIIINDNSKDNTLRIIKNYAKLDKRIKLVNLEKNFGAANAWNVAFKIAKGKYLSFLDSDDIWVESKLEEQINYMKKNNYSFTYTKYEWIDEQSKPYGKVIKIPKSINYKSLLKNTNIGLLTVIIDREKINISNVPIVYMDWDLWLWAQIMKKGEIAYGYDKTLAYYRIVSSSVSRNKKKAAMGVWNIYKNYLHIPFLKRVYYFICYAFNSVKRYYFD